MRRGVDQSIVGTLVRGDGAGDRRGDTPPEGFSGDDTATADEPPGGMGDRLPATPPCTRGDCTPDGEAGIASLKNTDGDGDVAAAAAAGLEGAAPPSIDIAGCSAEGGDDDGDGDGSGSGSVGDADGGGACSTTSVCGDGDALPAFRMGFGRPAPPPSGRGGDPPGTTADETMLRPLAPMTGCSFTASSSFSS
jgi:hypothetical protein